MFYIFTYLSRTKADLGAMRLENIINSEIRMHVPHINNICNILLENKIDLMFSRYLKSAY